MIDLVFPIDYIRIYQSFLRHAYTRIIQIFS